MTPDDPRHGTRAGYVAGCRDECCRVANLRARKAKQMRALAGEPTWVPHYFVTDAMQPWLQMGLAKSTIWCAAGLGREYPNGHPRHRYDSWQAILNITEDDLPTRARVYADLTRHRIYSLMAAGHRLTDMPIPIRGQWRTHDRIHITTARDIRDHFRALEFTLGSSAQTAARAKNAGHPMPLAWDDPGTLAWPTGRRPYVLRPHVQEKVRRDMREAS